MLTCIFLPSAFGAAPITNGLLVSVEANSTSISGTTWSPADGTSYSATLQSSSMYTSPDAFVRFGDNTNQYANFGNIGSTSSDISADMWVYITNMHSGWNILATKWFDGSGLDWHFGFYGGKLRNYFYNTNYVADTVSSAGGSGWYHVAFTIKQPSQGACPGTSTMGTASVYKNGVQVGTVTSVDACHISSSTNNFLIGDNRATANLGIDGKVSKFRFYTRALSLTEIDKLYRADASQYGMSAAPYASVLPTISGNAKVGSLQTGGSGTWLNGVTGYTYRWYRSNSSNGTYSPISGATSSNYTANSSDFNQYLKFEVTANNAQGSITETSTATQILQGSPTLTLTSGLPTATYRTIRNLGLNPGAEGKVTFTNNGKRIVGCVNLPSNSANSYSVTCPWKPSKIGFNEVKAQFTSTDSGYASGTSPITTLFVQKRSGNR